MNESAKGRTNITMESSAFISKSKYLDGLRCPKLIWHYYRAKHLIPADFPKKQAIFDQGHVVGNFAKKLFPGGIEIAWGEGPDKAIADSIVALRHRKPIYEGSFKYGNAFSRADILVPVESDAWDLVEVKSSTKLDDVHLHDVAFQLYCYEGAGVKVRNVYLLLINNEYLRDGEIDLARLFIKQDVTREARSLTNAVRENIDRLVKVISQSESPDTPIGQYCLKPHECVMKSVCWSYLPEDNVFTLNRFFKTKAFECVSKGILDICDIQDPSSLNTNQLIQWECRRDHKHHVDKKAIAEFLDALNFPLYLVDFETVSPAIPAYDKTRPFQQIPFQFSVHRWDDWNSEPKHTSFLAPEQGDPRPQFLKKLKGALGDRGDIVAYNIKFELRILKECADIYPEYRAWLDGIHKRTVDLLKPFRSFQYYNPKQKGSASIKQVLPALTGESYEGMEIADGSMASAEFARMIFTDVAKEDCKRIRCALEEYCKLDTLAMIRILTALRNQMY